MRPVRATAAAGACLEACTFPTEALGLGDADVNAADDTGHAPVRVDMAFANAAFLAEYPALKCRVLRTHDLALLSDHLPLKCGG